MENEAFTDMMEDFALLKLNANPVFFSQFCLSFVLRMEKGCQDFVLEFLRIELGKIKSLKIRTGL
jgi:hypothetical protein